MKPVNFQVQEHVIAASHIREYHRSTADDQEVALQLAVKQYSPSRSAKRNAKPVTIIGAHANGFPKELYEPLWDELFERLEAQGIHIQSIWIADVAHQGESGVINEEQLGDDPSWMDHPRDLLLMINHFRKQMKRPLIGIGHSMGGNNLVNLSLMHPRLLTTLVLVDPVIQRYHSLNGNYGPAKASTKRRDRWPSRAAAKTAFLKSPFYQAWDPRVLENWLEYGLRDLPSYVYPDSASNPRNAEAEVTLRTTKHQEVLSFLRANFPTADFPEPSTKPNPRTHPDVDPETHPNSPFYRPEPLATFRRLPMLRPSVLYLFGDQSALSAPLAIADKLANTGTGVGGSGGAKHGRVRQITFEGVGHLIPMEIVAKTADASASWIVSEIERWTETEALDRKEREQMPRNQRGQLREDHVKNILSDWDQRPDHRSLSKGPKL